MLLELRDIKKRRKRTGLTQREVAAMAGVSQSLIAKIESGSVNPSYENVKKIIETLDEFERGNQKVAKEIMNTKIIYVKKIETIEKVIDVMNNTNYSQLPVLEKGCPVGSVTERTIFDLVSNGKDLSGILKKKIEPIMDDSFPTVKENESVDSVSTLLNTNHAVLVTKCGKAIGIITKSDLFKIDKR